MNGQHIIGVLFLGLTLLLVVPVLAQLSAPTLISPANGAFTRTDDPTFTWNPVAGASFYTISIYSDSTLTNRVEGADVAGTFYTIPAINYGLSEGTYYWGVVARTGSSSSPNSEIRSFNAVYQISPPDGSTTSDATPTFEFDDPPLSREGFQLAVDNNDNFSSPEFTCTNPPYDSARNLFNCTPITPLANGTHYWGVQLGSRSGAFANSLFSWTVTITGSNVTPPPGTPTITSPQNGFAISNNRRLNIVWNAVPQAAQYEVQVDNNDNFGSPEFLTMVNASTPQVTTSSLPSDGRYYIRIRALNSLGSSAWSGVVWGEVDTTLPPAPQPFEPANGSTITYTRTPTLRYYASSGQNLYRVQISTNANFSSFFPQIQTTAHHITVASPLANATYYWRVQERDTAGNWSAWSRTANFIIR